jgi:hypothetical protein
VVDAFKKTSCLIIRSPKVKEEDNAAFLDLVEKYFSQKVEDLMKDVHPELNYSVGATPEFTEIPRDHTTVIEGLKGKVFTLNIIHIIYIYGVFLKYQMSFNIIFKIKNIYLFF